MAFESGIDSRVQAVLEAIEKTLPLYVGAVSALGWMPFKQAAPHAELLVARESPVRRLIGLAAFAVHRQDPGAALKEAIGSSDPLLKARALKAAGEIGKTNLLPLVKANLADDDLTCRYWAAWSSALLGEPAAVPVLQRLVESGHPHREAACAMAIRRMSLPQGQAWLKALAGTSHTLRLAVQAAGVIGDPAAIPWLMQQMANPNMARVAGESFSLITGIDLAYNDLDTDKPEGFEAGPTENPEDENVDMDADEDLPWPNTQLIEKWWFTHRIEFQHGARYFLGKPMAIDSLKEALRNGKQRQRRAAAIELTMRQPGTPLFNCSAPGVRQQYS